MAEITKDAPAEEAHQLPATKQQDGAIVALSGSQTPAAYDPQQFEVQKRGFFRNAKRKPTLSRGQFGALLRENIDIFSEYEVQLLRSIFELNMCTAQEIMVPLVEITPLTVESPTSEVLQRCKSSNQRYIPVYSERIDQLLGIVDAIEVITGEQDMDDLSLFVKEVGYAPPLKPAIDLLMELRQSEIPVAIVVNEHGSCIGIVELMDIVEKIIGEIAEKRKRPTRHIEKLGKDDWRIDARMSIVDLNKVLNTQIPTDRCNTIGGFILMLLGRLPQKGETILYETIEFNIDVVYKYGISQIRATRRTQG